MRAAARRALGPAALYFAFFVVLTWPAARVAGTHFFADVGDGLQNVWNIWWIDYAVVTLHQNPWHTDLLHYPYGTSLLGHTLTPFNGFIAIPFLRVLPLVIVHNGIVVFAFVTGGVTAFLLAYEITKAYWPSVLAGFIFTFSPFHFAHAEGHLQLVSLEWIPLFLLLWLTLLERPSVGLGIAAAVVLFLVLLCDHYYFAYCVLAAVIVLAANARRIQRRHIPAAAAFAAVTAATSGVLVSALLALNRTDPLVGAHPSSEFSLDLLGAAVYGGHWRFGSLTRAYWIRLPANPHETSVYLGFSLLALLAYTWRERRSIANAYAPVFWWITAVFFVLALGPAPQIAGKTFFARAGLLPYGWLERALPPLRMSGVPVRMMVMVTLGAAMLAAVGVKSLMETRRGRTIAAILTILLVVEYLPAPIPASSPEIPAYVFALRDRDDHDGVLDLVADQSLRLWYQTIHHKPLAFGYLARLPRSVARRDRQLQDVVESGRIDRLWPDYRLRYVVANGAMGGALNRAGAAKVWDDGTAGVFDVTSVSPAP